MARIPVPLRRRSRTRARIAVVGTGWWATQAHLPALLGYDRAEVAGIADSSPERLAAAAKAYGIRQAYTSHRELLEAERPDAVIVATPHASHYAIARDALEAGASVLVEKPMTLDPDEALELVRLAEQRRVHLAVGYTWHFNSHAQAIRRLVGEGRIGDLQLATILLASRVVELYRGQPERYRERFGYPVTGPSPTTYSDPAISGGGQGQLQLPHAAALLFWITGLQPRQVSAHMESFDLPVDLADAIAVRFAGGAVGTLTSVGSVRDKGRDLLELRLFGAAGAVVADFAAGTAEIRDGDGRVERLPRIGRRDVYPLHAPARHLADLVAGDAENQAPGALGALTVAFVSAAYRSAASGRSEELRPV